MRKWAPYMPFIFIFIVQYCILLYVVLLNNAWLSSIFPETSHTIIAYLGSARFFFYSVFRALKILVNPMEKCVLPRALALQTSILISRGAGLPPIKLS